MEIERIVDIAQQVAEGLAASHERGIIHGDLKPANVMVSADGQAKILDFGLSFAAGADLPEPFVSDTKSVPKFERDEDGASFEANTMPFVGKHRNVRARGTPGYVAPEAISGNAVSTSSDAFVFGLMLYEMVIGRRLLEARSLTETVRVFEQLNIHDKLKDIPPRLREIIRMLLDENPGRRPSMREISDLLASL
jgi:serine/threonine-protein kinase